MNVYGELDIQNLKLGISYNIHDRNLSRVIDFFEIGKENLILINECFKLLRFATKRDVIKYISELQENNHLILCEDEPMVCFGPFKLKII